MYYVSTRGGNERLSAAQAIVQGLARDGGLLTPEVFVKMPANAMETLKEMSYPQRAVYVMSRFLDDFSTAELNEFARTAYGPDRFDCPAVAPVRPVDDSTFCLELWHGPTCAFKDMALQMLPLLLSAGLKKLGERKRACILVATSGDTGKGALEGFKDVPQTKILVFYPKGGVSAIQELQMTTQEGDNVGVCAVQGNFDDAQTGVKTLFSDETLREQLAKRRWFLSSANSINWGRVLPQIVYYVSAYCDLLKSEAIQPGDKINVCVPTGNFGNILAAYYAKSLGVPINKFICASNANNVLTDFIQTGAYDRNRPFYNTLSPSMDILVSSNLERLLLALTGETGQVANWMDQLKETGRYQVDDRVLAKLQREFAAGFCDDAQTSAQIAKTWKEKGYLIDPHTAVAFHVLEEYRTKTGDETPALVVSTASPFKFCGGVLTALGVEPAKQAQGLAILDQLSQVTGCPVPAPLAGLKGKTPRFTQWVEKQDMVGQVLDMLM